MPLLAGLKELGKISHTGVKRGDIMEEKKVVEEVEEKVEADTEEKKFTQEELNDTVSKRLAKEKTKFEKELEEFKKNFKRELEEKEELAKLSERERAEKQLELDKKKLEEERAKLEKEKLFNETVKELSTRKLPTDLAEYVVADDVEATHERIKKFEKLWSESLQSAVDERLKGNTPKKPEVVENDDMAEVRKYMGLK